MATLGSRYLDMLDVLRNGGAEGETAALLIDMLAQTNPILNDMIAVECNNGTKHKHGIRTGLPTVSWGALYEGIQASKSHTQQVEDVTGFITGRSQVDERLLNKYAADKRAQVKMIEDMGFIEAMNQKMASALFYEDTATNPKAFKGLAARYNTRAGRDNPTAARQVIHGGGSGSDNTSIWMVTWGERFTHALYPQGTTAGIDTTPGGRQLVDDGTGNSASYWAEIDDYQWDLGLAVKDWRYNSRVANIDVSDLDAGNVDLFPLLRSAYYRLHSRKVNRPGSAFAASGVGQMRQVIYCNSTVMEALDAEAVAPSKGGNDSIIRLQPREVEGAEVLTYRGIPIYECDAILNTEAAVPAAA